MIIVYITWIEDGMLSIYIKCPDKVWMQANAEAIQATGGVPPRPIAGFYQGATEIHNFD